MLSKIGLKNETGWCAMWMRVGDLNLAASLLKTDANVAVWRSLRAIAFNKLLSQLIEEA